MDLRFLLALLPLGLFAPNGAAQTTSPKAERWLLMARHGECVEVGTLKRKVPDLGDIADPQAFAAFMRHKGFEVTATQRSLPNGKYWEVTVPAKELGLVFVTPGLCQGSR